MTTLEKEIRQYKKWARAQKKLSEDSERMKRLEELNHGKLKK